MGSKRYRNGTAAARLEREERARRLARQKSRPRRRIVVATGSIVTIIAIALLVTAVAHHGSETTASPFAGTTVEVSLSEYSIAGDLTAPAGEVRLHVTNGGGAVHNVGLRGGVISTDLTPNQSTMLDLGPLAAGTYMLYCDVDDHSQRGMVATLTVLAPTSTTGTSTTEE